MSMQVEVLYKQKMPKVNIQKTFFHYTLGIYHKWRRTIIQHYSKDIQTLQDLQSKVSGKTQARYSTKGDNIQSFLKEHAREKGRVEGCHCFTGKSYHIEGTEKKLKLMTMQ